MALTVTATYGFRPRISAPIRARDRSTTSRRSQGLPAQILGYFRIGHEQTHAAWAGFCLFPR